MPWPTRSILAHSAASWPGTGLSGDKAPAACSAAMASPSPGAPAGGDPDRDPGCGAAASARSRAATACSRCSPGPAVAWLAVTVVASDGRVRSMRVAGSPGVVVRSSQRGSYAGRGSSIRVQPSGPPPRSRTLIRYRVPRSSVAVNPSSSGISGQRRAGADPDRERVRASRLNCGPDAVCAYDNRYTWPLTSAPRTGISRPSLITRPDVARGPADPGPAAPGRTAGDRTRDPGPGPGRPGKPARRT